MLEFFDRPLLQHAVEQMVQAGVTHCVLVTEDTSAVMQRWGTGERWGCTFSAIPPHSIVTFLVGLDVQSIMVGRGDCIPCLSGISSDEYETTQTQLIFREVNEDGVKQRVFTGWALTQPQVLLERCFATSGANGLKSLKSSSVIQVSTCICCDTPQSFLKAQEVVLNSLDSAVIFHGMQIKPGVWAARNVTLHSTARIIGKVYLGENVRIGPHVTMIGPVVVCRDSAVNAKSVIADSSVQPGTYLGRGMSLQNDVVIERVIFRSRQGVAVKVDDPGRLATTSMSFVEYIKALLWSTNSTALLQTNAK